jgi:hypothetical protein
MVVKATVDDSIQSVRCGDDKALALIVSEDSIG